MINEDMEAAFPIEDIIRDTIQKHGLISENSKALAAVSGGADSVCLLFILKSIAEEFKFSLEAVHVNHQLRGTESDEDEKYVRSLCDVLGIKLHVFSLNIKQISQSKRMSLEEAGREARYEVFRQLAKKIGADVICVAHNRNDQAETVLLNIIRGTGLEGLKGMDYRNGLIVRPLLDIPRTAIEQFCQSKGLKPRVDSSNLDTAYTRNKIRLRLLPFIEDLTGRDAVPAIARMSKLLSSDNEYLKICAEEGFEKLLIEKDPALVKINSVSAAELHQALLSRVIRRCISELAGSLKGIEQKHIFEIMDFMQTGQTGSEIHLPHGIRVRKSYGELMFVLEREYSKFESDLVIPGKTEIYPLGLSVEATIINKESEEGIAGERAKLYYKENKDSRVQYFDYDLLRTGIRIRNRKNGDRITPRGMKGTKKLKDYFIDRKIPRHERNEILLIAKGIEVVWAVGFETNEKYKVMDSTCNILKLQIGKIKL